MSKPSEKLVNRARKLALDAMYKVTANIDDLEAKEFLTSMMALQLVTVVLAGNSDEFKRKFLDMLCEWAQSDATRIELELMKSGQSVTKRSIN